MFSIRFNPRSAAPVITALVVGQKGRRKLRLIFDTGAEMTQFHAPRMHEIGYAPSQALAQASVVGVGGVEGEGYVVKLEKLFVLGSQANAFNVGIFDMRFLDSQKLDGLLGWDIIREFHLEMDGPNGILNVF